MFCTKCGKELDDNAKFCKYCGCAVKKKDTAPAAAENSVSAQNRDISQSTNPVQSALNARAAASVQRSTKPEKKQNKVIIVLAIAVVILVILAAAMALLYFGEKSDSSDTTDQAYSSEYTDDKKEAEAEEDTQSTEETAAEEETTVSEQDDTYSSAEDSEFIFPDSDRRYLTPDELVGLSSWELRIARNEIYARHGRKFDDESLQQYFNGCSWYHGVIEPEDYDGDDFNEYEKANRDLIQQYEKSVRQEE